MILAAFIPYTPLDTGTATVAFDPHGGQPVATTPAPGGPPPKTDTHDTTEPDPWASDDRWKDFDVTPKFIDTPPAKNYTPYIVAGVGGLALIGLLMFMRRS